MAEADVIESMMILWKKHIISILKKMDICNIQKIFASYDDDDDDEVLREACGIIDICPIVTIWEYVIISQSVISIAIQENKGDEILEWPNVPDENDPLPTDAELHQAFENVKTIYHTYYKSNDI